MSDVKWFLLCIFSFVLLVIGLSSYDNSTYNSCVDICYEKSPYSEICKSNCYYYEYYGAGTYAAGIIFAIVGSVIVLCSIPIVAHRLNNGSPYNTRNAG